MLKTHEMQTFVRNFVDYSVSFILVCRVDYDPLSTRESYEYAWDSTWKFVIFSLFWLIVEEYWYVEKEMLKNDKKITLE